MPNPNQVIPASVRDAIVEAVRNEPTTEYKVIARRYDVAPGTVRKYAMQAGVNRKAVLREKRSLAMYAVPKRGDLREGMIEANDEQWAARMGVTLAEYRRRKGK